MSWDGFDDWDSKRQASGQYWSPWDLETAQNSREFADSGFTAKAGFAKAQSAGDKEGMAYWRGDMQNSRASYGNYKADDSGQGYISLGPARAGVNSTSSQIGSYGDFSYDPYDNSYLDYQKELLDRVVNRPDFSYAKDEDPVWSSYKKSYLREGERASANALAQASALTGGRPSSYAVSAASQAGDYYASKRAVGVYGRWFAYFAG